MSLQRTVNATLGMKLFFAKTDNTMYMTVYEYDIKSQHFVSNYIQNT